jgi:hypothetical protein
MAAGGTGSGAREGRRPTGAGGGVASARRCARPCGVCAGPVGARSGGLTKNGEHPRLGPASSDARSCRTQRPGIHSATVLSWTACRRLTGVARSARPATSLPGRLSEPRACMSRGETLQVTPYLAVEVAPGYVLPGEVTLQKKLQLLKAFRFKVREPRGPLAPRGFRGGAQRACRCQAPIGLLPVPPAGGCHAQPQQRPHRHQALLQGSASPSDGHKL